VSAHGFDALTLTDTGDENDSQAANVLTGTGGGWNSQDYYSAEFGDLKSGTGLILDMGQTVRLSSLTVQFGSSAGADVQIKMGSSPTRSAQNETSMATVASANDVGGSYDFKATSSATGRYLVIWFTKLPPAASGSGFAAQILSIIVRGTATSG